MDGCTNIKGEYNFIVRTDFASRLLMMKVVTQKGTRSGRKERIINILWSSLQEFCHSPGRGVFSGSLDWYHWCQSRGYWSKELAMPMKLASLKQNMRITNQKMPLKIHFTTTTTATTTIIKTTWTPPPPPPPHYSTAVLWG